MDEVMDSEITPGEIFEVRYSPSGLSAVHGADQQPPAEILTPGVIIEEVMDSESTWRTTWDSSEYTWDEFEIVESEYTWDSSDEFEIVECEEVMES